MPKTNLQRLDQLRSCVWTQQHSLVLQHYLQARNLPKDGTVELNKLFKKAVLVTLCCDQTSARPYQLLGLGVATFDRLNVSKKKDINTFAGPHAENYLTQVWSMHIRLRETAHLQLGNDSHNAYHFGTSIFATKGEAIEFLNQIWTQPIDEENPECGLRPVICLHHGNANGPNAIWQTLGFDPTKMDTTIAMLDSQVIAEQSKLTRNPYAEIQYILDQFKIQGFDAGNCGNVAIYITIASVLSTLRKHLYQSPNNPKAKPGMHGQSASKAAQAVVNELMERPTPAPPVGTEVYCLCCGSLGHFLAQCPHNDLVSLP